MTNLKMTGEFYDDVKRVDDAINYLYDMLDILEKERMEKDEGEIANGLFIRINDMKREVKKLVEESKRALRDADIEQFGPLSKYVRPYLSY